MSDYITKSLQELIDRTKRDQLFISNPELFSEDELYKFKSLRKSQRCALTAAKTAQKIQRQREAARAAMD